ncbi:hypothetical protein K493DRAFT_318734 [Basidiobolus meristosporus CBS 931.73]|uniref:Uncharacterized protein n=1 Tax=Basidiobolus meristosporus CBS 931.73 TaxID=1314790 RepID=A0A1Y1XUD3_9FUNG|nr:hypothetical protein K493DRAFT_318734 [Basidiobolus meristosporus CBS 931.73]|eukprot:ORX89372.1 hypothetical protein K493DRAFT_318734 [Basidiobolus meristosporus CBS 931.73]
MLPILILSFASSLSLLALTEQAEDHAPREVYPVVVNPAIETLDTWRQKIGNAVDYIPGDEYEENEFEGYADNYAYLLPEAQNQYDADDDEDEADGDSN